MNWYIRTSKVCSFSDWEARLRAGQKRIGICGKIRMSFVEVPERVQSVHSDQSEGCNRRFYIERLWFKLLEVVDGRLH